MVLGMRIGGLAAVAVSAWLALSPAQPAPETFPPPALSEAAPSLVVYRPPVDAEVVDSFRPPAHVGAPGNRGLEYDPEPGQPVWASAGGEVVFAGQVARNRFVTVLHRDGLRTSYGYLGWMAVDEGDMVTPGQLLGTTSGRFFFSVRIGDQYLDPALVLSSGRVRLVPHGEAVGRGRLPA
ncbi:MAG: M23 family metallopeptidase [Acidimicrobiia bacterium]|nr:M23 family metallopeptidase [Acidimicrobiia bacterium]MYB11341.1 M23 family metallopeptidase [Acidimicrobiia bacterium]MYG59141.1 M23 family metallopeptidase [Acidimicrobiia bacterium]MYG73738.1 M23 family metallopeptidase [Acidimicrobiia bacterium]MYJ33275.1 M23 family metallopeptidase [Acidimicrobiia bacterium]